MAQLDSYCVICDAAKDSLYFSPCLHSACQECVKRIRIANVYKADKGVKCPFCRKTIEGYLDSPPKQDGGEPHEKSSSSKVETRPENLFGKYGNMSIGQGNDYMPCRAATGGLKLVLKVAEVPPGYVIPPLRPDADIHAMAFDKRAINLVFMLREDYSKHHKVAKLCRDALAPVALRLALHGSANYVLQAMLDYAAANREDAVHGEGFFTALVRSLCKKDGFVKAAQDIRGTYSAQKMLLLMQGSDELRLVMKSITGSVAAMSANQTGAYVIQWLAERLISSLREGGPNPRFPVDDAVNSLAQLASEMTAHAADILSIGVHPVSGPVLVEIIRWSLPNALSVKSALDVSRQAKRIVDFENGHRILQGLLSVEVKEVAEEIINDLQGKFPDLVLDSICWKLVQACLATRCVDESSRLTIVDEIIYALYCSFDIVDTPFSFKVLAFGLAILSQRSLDDRLEILKRYITLRKFESLTSELEIIRWSRIGEADMSPQISRAASEGSTCEFSMDADPDYGSSNESSSPPQRSLPHASIELQPAMNTNGDSGNSIPSPPPVPTETPGTYTLPHVRQQLAQVQSSRELTSGDQPVPSTRPSSSPSLGAIGSKRENSSPLLPLSCVLCSTRSANTVFLNCSHMCCCHPCSAFLSSCPMCNSPILQVIKVEPAKDQMEEACATSTSGVASPSTSTNTAAYPSAIDLLPSDLFQAISLGENSIGMDAGMQFVPFGVTSSLPLLNNGRAGTGFYDSRPVALASPYRPPGIFPLSGCK